MNNNRFINYINVLFTGQVYSLGRKEYGRLGMGADATDLSVPTLIPTLNSLKLGKFVEVACGEAVSLAVSESGSFHC